MNCGSCARAPDVRELGMSADRRFTAMGPWCARAASWLVRPRTSAVTAGTGYR